MISITAPFIIVQKRDFDYLSGTSKIFRKAEHYSAHKDVRDQHATVVDLLKAIFQNAELRKGVTISNNSKSHSDIFKCPIGRSLSLVFQLAYMDKKATHAAFLMASPNVETLESKRKMGANPDTDPGYPGRISLRRNRVVMFEPKESTDELAKDRRYWELYSTTLATRVPDRKTKETYRK